MRQLKQIKIQLMLGTGDIGDHHLAGNSGIVDGLDRRRQVAFEILRFDVAIRADGEVESIETKPGRGRCQFVVIKKV